jgi:hypothetical protein
MIQGLTEGRIVRYFLAPEDVDQILQAKTPLPEGRSVVALIVGITDAEAGLVDLTLFPNWAKDNIVTRGSAIPIPLGILWKQDVKQSDEHEPGTWDLPEFSKKIVVNKTASVGVTASTGV